MDKETRVMQISELRVRSIDGKPTISGYAAVFDKMSEDLGGFREKIEPGAFRSAIKTSDTRALFNHNPDYVLGRQSNNTLRLKEDSKGLHMEVDPPDTQFIRDLVLTPIERGDITQQSFGFIVESDKWEGLNEADSRSKEPVRTILKVAELFDVSPVTYPAYPDTAVAVRQLEQAKESLPFVPLTIPELLRNYSDRWEELGNREDNELDDLISLSVEMMTEFKQRFIDISANPTIGDEGNPTIALQDSNPTIADEAEVKERSNELLNKIKQRGI